MTVALEPNKPQPVALDPSKPQPCEICGAVEGTKLVHAMTAYHFTGEHNSPEDPNRDQWLCVECEKGYVEYWTAAWDEYYSSQGY